MTTASLAAIPLFCDLDADQHEELNGIAVATRAPADQLVFSQGDPARALFALVSGRVRVFKLLHDGRCVTVRLVEAPDTFGESALFSDAYPSNALVLEDALLYEFPGPAFKDLLARRPDLSGRLLATQTRRMIMLNQRIEELLLPVHLRLARFLLDGGPGLKSVSADRVRLDISKRELAARIGVAPATLSRAFDKLARADLIKVAGRDIAIVKPRALALLVDHRFAQATKADRLPRDG
jgi:CRP-like cAMP-binding protein